jgi:tripartite-type tricarboxylate transporter receptor subunit TctC
LTVKFIVGFPAGGAQDIVGRVIADRLGALWKVPTVVENVAGADGNLGMDRVAKGPSQGSQICIVPPGIATNQYLYPRVPFDPEKDFVLLGHVASVPNLLCVRKDLPVNNVAELIAHTKANPGKLNYASSGTGTTVHLSAEPFKRMAGSTWCSCLPRQCAGPQRSGGAKRRSDVRRHYLDHRPARAGAVKPLVTQRSTLALEFPPIAETVPGYDTTSWTGVAVRARTPKAICDKIEADTKIICQVAVLKERLAGLVAETVGTGATDFTAYVAAARAKWAN